MTKPKDLKKRFMEDPEFREQYARVDEEYALVEALVGARTAAKLTQAAVARPLGTTQSAIARVEGGQVSPSFAMLRRHAEATGTLLTIAAGRKPVRQRLQSGLGPVRRCAVPRRSRQPEALPAHRHVRAGARLSMGCPHRLHQLRADRVPQARQPRPSASDRRCRWSPSPGEARHRNRLRGLAAGEAERAGLRLWPRMVAGSRICATWRGSAGGTPGVQ